MDSPEEALLSANAAFYDAFNKRDIARMASLWAEDAPVACVHPGWPALIGREEVMKSWRGILMNPRAPRVRWADASAHLYGAAAFVVCTELVDDDALIATNFFCLEQGEWKLVHHHAGPTATKTAKSPPKPPPKVLN